MYMLNVLNNKINYVLRYIYTILSACSILDRVNIIKEIKYNKNSI